MIKISEYQSAYADDVKKLLVQLQEYLTEIDLLNVQTVSKDYSEEYFRLLMNELQDNSGKVFLALQDNKVVGLTAVSVEEKDCIDRLTTRCPKRGKVSELIVDESFRGGGIGSQLINKAEQYFKSLNCEFISVDVFAPNQNSRDFYAKHGYGERNIEVIKRI